MIGLVDKVLFLSHPKFHLANMESLINSLRNGYPLQLLLKIIKNRIKFLSNKNKFETINEYDRKSNLNSVGNKKYFSIPYLQGVSEKFNRALNKYKFQLVLYINQ